jgi:hypothetical protein
MPFHLFLGEYINRGTALKLSLESGEAELIIHVTVQGYKRRVK